MSQHQGGRLLVLAPDGVPEVRPGADLVALLLAVADLVDGDVVCVTSKVVSKAEGRIVAGHTRDAAVADETVRLVARRGATSIVRTRLGLTMAAAGVDASNVEPGSLLLLPEAPDASAVRMRRTIVERTGRNVAVVVTDTAGRAWREGQTDIAIGAAGLIVLDSHLGRVDSHGNELVVTAPAVADELASAAELTQGKLAGRPFAVVRGRSDLVLPPGQNGPGAAAVLRVPATDLFGFGAREAVLRALLGKPADRSGFGDPATPEEMTEAIRTVTGLEAHGDHHDHDALVVAGADQRLTALAYAFGWALAADHPAHADGRASVRLRPHTP